MSHLDELDTLLIDCQATGSSPAHGRLLEFGWVRARPADGRAAEDLDVVSFLVAGPDDEDVPRRVRELTGIEASMLEGASTMESIESRFLKDARAVDLLIAHYATFEKRFLKAEVGLRHPDAFRDLEFFCTHELARRLFPDLPRRGIRAMAGYFGYDLPEKKRVEPHLRGTHVIWTELLRVLKETEDIRTRAELEQWMEATDPGRTEEGYSFPVSREDRLSIPDHPGTYRMKDRADRILYVGKARSLKDRVNTYFQSGRSLSERKLELVSRVHDVAYRRTDTPLEAALAETREIKRHDPPYNTALVPGRGDVWYVDPALRRFRDGPASRSTIGPVHGRRNLLQLRDVIDRVRGRSGPGPASSRFGRLLSEPAFDEGWKQFLERHDLPPEQGEAGLERFLRIGRILWEEWRERERTEDEDEPEDSAGADRDHRSPDQMTSYLESMVRRAARDVRVANWLSGIRGWSLAWKPRVGVPDGCWRCLRGTPEQVCSRETVEERPHPSSIGPPPDDVDPITGLRAFDRMRVLTTELKRLIRRERPVVLRASKVGGLTANELAEALWWV